ncbi:LysR family transcriptional regulator [Tatumella morbirosei]|uniref:LysR family transcriptional regulator n=1 Tax=Tatumella morbirosei TaxID=642227 RepID=A0A095T696_9GAMM|nr:LysR family transcriptional regulator [Tatumella morbirosei]KGD72044.1 LysR family transcriptional regulator [Tatumella morbirosei]
MDRVMAAQVFNRICEAGSLSAAARALGISRPMVSRYLEEMEKWAGARLIHRSSRHMTLTPAGEEILQKTRQLNRLSEDISGQAGRETPSGILRVACAHYTATHLISPVLPEFLLRYPDLRIELDINNRPVNMIGERIDVAIRITENPEPGAIARRLGECASVICASPEYLSIHGTPASVSALSAHNCLSYSNFSQSQWQLLSEQGETLSLAVNGNLSAGISAVLLDAALAGCGITMIPLAEASPWLAKGRLVTVLPQYTPLSLGIYGMYLSRKLQPPALRLFLEEIQRRLQTW